MLTGCADLSIAPVYAIAGDDSYVLVFEKGDILLAGGDDQPQLPTYAQLAAMLPKAERLFALASVGNATAYAPHPFDDVRVPEGNGLRYQSVRAFMRMDEPQASLLTACSHLWRWYMQNRYCGKCGKPFMPSQTERALVCTACGNIAYPMIAPAVIVAITKGDALLLAQNRLAARKHHTLIAGYVEVGETLEHAVRREAMEEVGLTLGQLRYLGDQPWGMSGSLMFGFQAEVTGDDTIRIQESELSEAAWYPRAELPSELGRGSIAYELIERFRRGEL